MKRYVQKIARRVLPDLSPQIARLEAELTAVTKQLAEIAPKLQENQAALEKIERIVKSNRDNIPYLREKLLAVRRTAEYKKVFENKHPLISVRIATYNRAKVLVERTIPSIQAQTYDNWELIVVGDQCPDDTEERIRKLGDKRIRFYNFPFKNVYPEDPLHRWYSAGTPGMNKGVELARGDWIAPQDDDDEFTPDHLEVLLKTALEGCYEMVYGRMRQLNTATGKEIDIWDYPPKYGSFGSQGALYMNLLNFIEYDTNSWIVDEPGDWNFCRRMMQTGVIIGTTKHMVTKLNYTPKV